jgi:hypothetical protein
MGGQVSLRGRGLSTWPQGRQETPEVWCPDAGEWFREAARP